MEDTDMDNNPPRSDDTRDVRTGQGATPRGDRVRPERTSSDADEGRPLQMPDDPVSAVNPMARPSDYTMDDIEEGDTPLDEGMDRMVDPSLGRERLSNNMDVLDLDGSWIAESEEPDFSDDPGTTDVIEAIEEAEPYFPPTDPVTRIN